MSTTTTNDTSDRWLLAALPVGAASDLVEVTVTSEPPTRDHRARDFVVRVDGEVGMLDARTEARFTVAVDAMACAMDTAGWLHHLVGLDPQNVTQVGLPRTDV